MAASSCRTAANNRFDNFSSVAINAVLALMYSLARLSRRIALGCLSADQDSVCSAAKVSTDRFSSGRSVA